MRILKGGWPWVWGKIYGLISRNPASNLAIVEEAAPVPGERVLDIGCGAGRALLLAGGIVGNENVTGVDPTASLADTARRRVPGARVEVAIAEDLPLPDDSFDVVWTIASFHHWEMPQSGLEEIERVLAPGGRVLIAERLLPRDGGHGLSEGDAGRLASQLEQVGLTKVDVARRDVKRQVIVMVKGQKPTRQEQA